MILIHPPSSGMSLEFFRPGVVEQVDVVVAVVVVVVVVVVDLQLIFLLFLLLDLSCPPKHM